MANILNALRISYKLPLAVAGAALLVGVGVGIGSYQIGSSTVDRMSEEKLETLAVSRQHEVERFMHRMETDIKLYADDPATQEALVEFSAGFNQLGSDAARFLQQSYIATNPNPAGEKHLLDRAAGTFTYNETHDHYHHFFREVAVEKKYYDLFLFDTEGRLIYSVYKEPDFTGNFGAGRGALSETGLGKVFQGATGAARGHMAFADFAPYAPSGGKPAAFLATPVIDEQQKHLGVLAIQLPASVISELFHDKTGLGETGETVLVGEDGLLRIDSDFTEVNDTLTTQFNPEIVAKAVSNNHSSGIINDYRGMPMRVSAAKFDFEGQHWVVAAVESVAEVSAPVVFMRNFMLLIGGGLVAAIALGGFFFARTITNPISNLTNTMGALADGDLEVEVLGSERSDEIGEMARAVEIFKENSVERRRLEGETEAEQRARESRQSSIDTLISNFRETVSSALEVVASNTTEMSATANTLTAIANDTSGQANDAANASQSASENVQAVAAAAEELAASIEEISRQVARTNSIVNEANEATSATNEKVANLARAAQKIGDVISLIQDIAEQTNLLALNTSIEAARAGEAGKGFAVVASEVKSLANQTATATEEISAQIADIQGSTTEAVAAIEQIAKTMGEVNSYTASIASAVEEQGAATSEISQSVAQAASGTKQVVGSMGVVTNSVGETNQSAGQVLAASEDVAKQAHTLKSTIDKFLSDVAAA